MGQQDNSRIWDSLYQDFEPGSSVGIRYPTEALVIFLSNLMKSRDIHEYFDDLGTERRSRSGGSGVALEIGFGSIANLKVLRDFGFTVQGIDVSQEAVERGRIALEEQLDPKYRQIQLSHWDAEQAIPLATDTANLVVGLQCVYYNLNMLEFLSEIKRILRPGGHLLFSFFSPRHDYQKFARSIGPELIQFTEAHPNPRLRGLQLISPSSKEALKSLFEGNFRNISIFTTESDQTPVFESWFYVHAEA